ncbi:helix-turn-helix domain-containing protein [Companilactobacillus sp. FL22-1]|uniref:helix-turn-helix domain-containing protein n=1 Tax=Companilactobacillus sp. FL22-1 TaxID=3373892 RepID=UPI003754719C
MVKFNLDFKIKMVTEYLTTTLAKKHGITQESTILNWVHNFELTGIKGLESRKMDLNYSIQFKVEIINRRNQET